MRAPTMLCLVAAWLVAPPARAQPATDPSSEVTDDPSGDASSDEADAYQEDDAAEAVLDPANAPPDGALDVLSESELDDDVAPPTESRLGQRDIARMPGSFGDAFRAIDALPGVAPMATGLPHLFVRGATPSSSGYYIDGIEVPFLFHLAVGPAVINPAIIDDVTFYPGAFPARFGRHVGGIISATTREPAEQVRAEATVRLFDAGAFVDVPIGPIDTNVFGAFRYSYLAPLLSVFAPETSLEYWDYLGGAWYQIAPRDRVGFLAFGSRDHLGQIESTGRETELFGAEFHRATFRFERAARSRHAAPDTPRGVAAKIAFTLGTDRSGLSDQAQVSSTSYQLRNEVEVPIIEQLTLRGGLDLHAEVIDFASPAADEQDEDDEGFDFDITEAFASRAAGTVGAWLDVVVAPVDEVEVVAGIRTDLFAEESATQVGVDPRGMLRLRPTKWLTTITGAGQMHQKPALIVTVPGLVPVGLAGGLQSAIQLSQGAEFALPANITFGVTGFHHWYEDLSDLTATCTAEVRKCSVTERAGGRAYGLELLLQRSLGERVGGLVSYTLARSEREVRREVFVADFDRTHVFNAAVGVDFGSGWHAGARLSVMSGRPHSLIRFDDPEDPNEPSLVGERNALRRDAFHRLDLRLEKRWVIADFAWIAVVLEGFNVTLQKETIDFDCRVAEVLGAQSGLSCGGQEIGPIAIPSLGVSGGI